MATSLLSTRKRHHLETRFIADVRGKKGGPRRPVQGWHGLCASEYPLTFSWENTFGSVMGRPLTWIRVALVQHVIKFHHTRDNPRHPLRSLDEEVVCAADRKQSRMVWKIRRIPGRNGWKTSRVYEVLEDPPPHQASPRGSACLDSRPRLKPSRACLSGNDKWKILPKKALESPVKSPCKGVAMGVHGPRPMPTIREAERLSPPTGKSAGCALDLPTPPQGGSDGRTRRP